MSSILYSIRYINEEIDDLVLKREAIATNLCNIVAPIDNERVQGSGEMQKISLGVAKMVDIDKEINAKIDLLSRNKEIFKQIIKKIPNEKKQEILFSKYFEGKGICRIAKELKMHEKSVSRLHKQAKSDFFTIESEYFSKNA